MPHERMSQYAGRERFEQEAGRMREAYGRAQDMLQEHPGYSALACFGVGLAVGAAITLLLAPDKPSKFKAWYEDYLPDEHSASDLADQVRETVKRMLPDALARYFKR